MTATTTQTATVTVDRRQLSAVLARIVDTAPAKSSKPIFQNVKISVNGSVTLAANDQMNRYHVETLGSADSAGVIDVLVDARRLRKAVTSSKAKQLTLELSGDSVKIGSQTIPATDNPEDFPTNEKFGDLCNRGLSAESLITLIERTYFACDTESSRYALGGVLVEMDQPGGDMLHDSDCNYLRLVGTDGRRLATDYVGNHRGSLVSAVWPVAAVKGCLKSLKKADSCILGISEDETYITLLVNLEDGGTARYVMRVLEGKFPKWQKVIHELSAVCEVEADRLADVLTAATAATSDESRPAEICCADDVLTVSTSTEGIGSYFDGLDVATYDNPLDVTIDVRFLLDWCKACKGCVLSISAFDKAKERGKDTQDCHGVRIECGSADYVVMPFERDKKKRA